MIGARTVVHAAHEKRRLLVLMETVELRFHRFHSVTTATGKKTKTTDERLEANGLLITTRPPNRGSPRP